VFWWVPHKTETININKGEDSNIDLTELTNASELRKLGQIWSFLFGIEFDDFMPGTNAILDVGGDGCYQFVLAN